jgi:hypothetical protein
MEDVVKSLNYLIIEIQTKIANTSNSLDSDVQKELANLLNLAQRAKSLLASAKLKKHQIQENELESVIPNIITAIYALQGEPNKTLARNLRRDAEFIIRRLENPITAFFINGVNNFIYLTQTPTKVIFGLLVALPVHLAAPFILAQMLSVANIHLKPILAEPSASLQIVQNTVPKQSETSQLRISQYDFDEACALLLLCAIAGSTGSVVSILTRIQQYENEEYEDSLLPVFVGAFKPMIGAFFGILIFALLNSTLLPISISKDETKPTTKWFGFMALAFVVGFSERFAKDIVSQTEKLVPGEAFSQNTPRSSTNQLYISDETVQDKQQDNQN